MFDVSMILKLIGFSIRFPRNRLKFVFYSPTIGGLMPSGASLPSAWVVKCVDCHCIVNCFAIDPQEEHISGNKSQPQKAAVVVCSCCLSSYRYSGEHIYRGVPSRSPKCRRGKQEGKFDGALLVASCLTAAIRLRGEEIKRTPKVVSTINDSVRLARMVLEEIEHQ
jgi:hypothetical protein